MQGPTSPEYGADERVARTAAQATWGTGFPEDRRGFLTVYGSGSISDEAEVLTPAPVGSGPVAAMRP